MITVSLCMIVKNEASVLKRCLDSVADLVDEIIIVDTGSTDTTKEIAGKYTQNLYDFIWVDDFSAARNFAFSKAHMDYIYTADADEVMDQENRERFRRLKETLLPEIEIVQMKYANQMQFQTVYNFDEEYRPKLFKRLREFIWEDPIHEMVRLTPVVYDSDIVIGHYPQAGHGKRDLETFRRHWQKGEYLSKRLHNMYARELLMAGEQKDFEEAMEFFIRSAADPARCSQEIEEACVVLAHGARLLQDTVLFFKYVSKVIAGEGNSEICYEMGCFYEEQGDWEEAALWYYNAVYETGPILNIRSSGEDSLDGLIRCYESLGLPQQVEIYRKQKEEILKEKLLGKEE